MQNANDGQGGIIQPSQELGQDPFAVFNEPIPLASEDDGTIPLKSDEEPNFFSNPVPSSDQQTQTQNPAEPNADDQQKQENDVFKFKDDLVDEFETTKETPFNADDAIKKLQEQGYDVKKLQAPNQSQEQEIEYQRLESERNNALMFLNKSDDEVILEKVRDDIAREYQSFGKQHLIGTQEYEDEVQEKVYRISENPTQKELYAKNVKDSISRYVDQVESKIQAIDEKKETEFKRQVAEGRKMIQNSLQHFMANKFLGMDVSQQEAEEVYEYITSRKFTEETNNNPQLVVEFALFNKNREKIMNALGGATYGEGVKAAVDAINKTAATPTKSPLQMAMTGSSNTQGASVNRRQFWNLPTEDTGQSSDSNKSIVAGRGSF